jgi:hypothetical protein
MSVQDYDGSDKYGGYNKPYGGKVRGHFLAV